MKTRITIGICTRQRNALLRRLLESIWEQPVPPNYEVGIVVIDNNDAPAVTEKVTALPPKFKLTVVHEPKAGLVNARNRVLDVATASDADWLIGVDDDEWVAPDWLENYIKAFETLDTSIIVAAKRVIYSAQTSPLISHIQQEQVPAGAPTRIFSTANFAMHRRVFHSSSGLGLRFDLTFNECGAEDFELMLRAKHQHGLTALKWPYAIAFEAFDGKRETFRYHFKRRVLDQVTRYRVAAVHRKAGVRGSLVGNALKISRLTIRFTLRGTANCLQGLFLLAIGRKNAYEVIGNGLFRWARAFAVFPYLLGKSGNIYGSKANADRTATT